VLPFLILVFVDAHDAASPLPAALARAAEGALGQRVEVSERTLAADAPAAALVEAGRAERANFAARVSWIDERRSQARLEVVAVDGDLRRSSTIAFDPSDPLPERGRALGLVLAALVAPEKQARLEREARPPPAAVAPAVTAAIAPPAPPPPRRFALDAAATGGFAIGGAGSGAGGTIGLRWHPGKRIGLRLGAQARFGQVASAQSDAVDLAGAAGLVLFVIPPADSRYLALALRADALLMYESLSHLSSDDPAPVRSGRLLPGGLALIEGQWALSPTLALALGAGVEAAFGRTDIFVRQEKVAELAALRALVAGGLVARF
jgi:hypothetical protein